MLSESTWAKLTWILPALAVAETLIFYLHNRKTKAANETTAPPPLQFWLQDLLVLALLSGFYLSNGDLFVRTGNSLCVPLCSIVLFDLCSQLHPVFSRSAIIRAGLLFGLFTLTGRVLTAPLLLIWMVKLWCSRAGLRRRSDSVFRRTAALAIALVYGIAFALPVTLSGNSVLYGAYAYLFCAAAVINLDEWLFIILWLANPAFWLGLTLFMEGRWLSAAACGAAGASLALTIHREIAINSPGYYLWTGSMAMLAAAGLAGTLLERSAPKAALPQFLEQSELK